MPVEAGTYIDDLVTTNPVGATDYVSAGDDHLRLLKTVLKGTFPNASKAFYFPTTVALVSGNVSVVAADANKVMPISCEAAARTVTLPASSLVEDGFEVTIVKADHSPNLLTITGSSDTINGATSVYLWQRYQRAKLIWCDSLGGWFADIPDVPDIGSIHASLNSTLAPGYVWANGQTIGSATSGASQRANADCLGLYTVLWNSVSDSVAVVNGGRGASAAADFAANKRMTLPNLSGRMLIGKDVLGGGADAGLIGNIIAEALGSVAGAERVTIAQANLPNVTLTGTTDTGGAHTPVLPFGLSTGGGENGSNIGSVTAGTTNLTAVPAHQHTFTTSSINGNVTQTAMSNLPPAMVTLWMFKL